MTSNTDIVRNIPSRTPAKTPSKTPAKTPCRTPSKTPNRRPSQNGYGDRFIPARTAMNKNLQLHSVMNVGLSNNENWNPDAGCTSFGGLPAPLAANGPNAPSGNAGLAMAMGVGGVSAGSEFSNKLAHQLFEGSLNSKILAFKSKAPKPNEEHQQSLRAVYSQNQTSTVKKPTRQINSTPERVLDAPSLLDDFYLNLLDWSTSDLLAVALGSSVYIWNAASGKIDVLYESKQPEELLTSVSWMSDGVHLAISSSDGNAVQLWDVQQQRQVRSMRGHSARVGSLAWNEHLLSSGSRDCSIFNHDVRIQQHHIATLTGHEQEICGLRWSPDGTQLASGANDNRVCIFDSGNTIPRFCLQDSAAAVKALAWCPWQRNVLAAGGGTADRHIRFYNTTTGALINSIDTKSQVCQLVWSRHEKELLSAHGFSQNQLCVWKYPSMAQVAELTGHTSRVLHCAVSADGTTVCSAAADETLRFWKVWAPRAAKKRDGSDGRGGLMNMNIR